MNDLIPLAETIAARLKARRESIAIAESSTGGLISATLLALPGASAYFLGGASLSCRLRNRASRPVLVAALAAEVVHVVNRYSEIARGPMIAGEIVDKFLALPAAVTRAA